MVCTDCGDQGAECLTAERVRVCVSCLYERTARERDALREELARIHRLAPVGLYTVSAPHEEEILRLRALLDEARGERHEARCECDAAVEAADRLTRERDEARANYAFMVERAANEKLDGYRELGARAAAAENKADKLNAQLDEALEELEALQAHIREHLPYQYDDGEDDDASPEECVEYAAREIRVLKRERDEARAEIERLRDAVITALATAEAAWTAGVRHHYYDARPVLRAALEAK